MHKFDSSIWLKVMILPIAVAGAILLPRLACDPYHAETFSALAQQVQEHEAEAVRQEITWKISAAMTDGTDIEKQWQKMKDILIAESDNVSEIEGIYQTAHTTLNGQWWPVFIHWAQVKDQPVWVVGAGWPKGNAAGSGCIDGGWQKEPPFEPEKGMGQYKVVVISAQKPFSAILQ